MSSARISRTAWSMTTSLYGRGCDLLLGLLADRHHVRRRLPDLFIGQHTSPRRHAQTAFFSAIGNRLENALGVKLAAREIDAARAVYAMAMRTLLCQIEIMTRRDRFRVLEIRTLLRKGHIANENPCDRCH